MLSLVYCKCIIFSIPCVFFNFHSFAHTSLPCRSVLPPPVTSPSVVAFSSVSLCTCNALTNFFYFLKLSLYFSPFCFICFFFFTAIHLFLHIVTFPYPVIHSDMQLRSGETAAIVARELAEQTKGLLHPGDVPSTVRAMVQLVELLDVQLRNLTPGGKDSAARSLTKVLS